MTFSSLATHYKMMLIIKPLIVFSGKLSIDYEECCCRLLLLEQPRLLLSRSNNYGPSRLQRGPFPLQLSKNATGTLIVNSKAVIVRTVV